MIQTRTAAPKKQRPAELPGGGLDQLRHRERTLSNLLSFLQAVQCALSPQPCLLSPRLGWGSCWYSCFWVISAPICKPSPCPVSNHNKTHGSPSWTLVLSVLWSVMGSLTGVSRCVCCVYPGKVLSYNSIVIHRWVMINESDFKYWSIYWLVLKSFGPAPFNSQNFTQTLISLFLCYWLILL